MKHIKRIFEIFKKLLRAKYILTFPEKNSFLIFDRNSTNVLEKTFPQKKFFTLDTRYESINLPILLITFFEFKFTYRSYIQRFVDFVEPKILITLIDNNKFFFKLKLKKGKKILIQNSRRGQLVDLFGNINISEIKEEYQVDYMFVQNQHIGKLYNRFIKGKIIPFGNIRCNNEKIIKLKKKLDFVYISTGRYDFNGNHLLGNVKKKKIYEKEIELLKLLKKFCQKNKIKLFILGKDFNFTKEKKYYKNILGEKNFHFLNNYKNRKTYKIIDNCNMVVGMDSTLIYEAFSRGNKCFFASFRFGLNFHIKSTRFSWPQKMQSRGKFWINYFDKKKINQGLNKVYFMKKKEWSKISQKFRKDVMPYDPNNTIIKKYLDPLLSRRI